jgi:predicted nuclease of restriction endonuclease-like (RecB) superfamily
VNDLDTQISQAHAAAEATEQQARHLEARILKTGAALPKRQYGSPLNPEALKQNLTTRSLICKRDPELASFLGLQDGSYRREAEEREARILQGKALEMQTEALRQRNQAAADARYKATLSPLITGWRRG